ncbi:5-(carboxyamino)imidazole ribonucleotide mutase [Proteiniclasticum sp. QWL-01]|uniref:5-(carboxyamino)imidazole ribonucleotide mutase n=1 Tax=Proteiniclasticum sp. QWL-01 TaxID=3036945 RepID=UPI002201DC80|nr:5-(carboxyamino)imidazole ribonucleotide mutase [Proteiniclasticum sp. QWL-01]UUM13143.1 5-(carboxyamino)imidazole ribonucleotide mutase [Clostridiaceae bacterium HFYG-1003]WFF71568.1 5-(carboxyamino)imidazole ribonucleotide mutase [Proteiniclasticum sp. QWL-01]
MKVGIIFGSRSDQDIMKKAYDILTDLGIESESYVLSAHRVPEQLHATIRRLEEEGTEVFIAGAGLAAHLPGVIASLTVKPVIGVPLKGALEGLDALLSIVQMPKQIPVATVGINNAANAGMLAAQILGVKYPEVAQRLNDYRSSMKENFLKENNGKVEY